MQIVDDDAHAPTDEALRIWEADRRAREVEGARLAEQTQEELEDMPDEDEDDGALCDEDDITNPRYDPIPTESLWDQAQRYQ
jgi:hypothetical protein